MVRPTWPAQWASGFFFFFFFFLRIPLLFEKRWQALQMLWRNGLKLYPFWGHSSFRVIHWETIVTKSYSQTLMAMKSECKIYTHKCYVTLEWPLMLHFTYRLWCPQFVPSENNSACERFREQKFPFLRFFPQAALCPFSILGRTLSDRQPSTDFKWI